MKPPAGKFARSPKAPRNKPGRILYISALIVLGLVLLISAGLLLQYCMNSQKNQQAYQELRLLRGDYTRPTFSPPGSSSHTPAGSNSVELVTVTDPETGLQRHVLPQFEKLYPLNTDLAGWLTIPGTDIDYPIVHRPKDKDYYLHRDFYKEQAPHGCLYVQEDCDPATPSDNVIIHGHRMKDGTMFGQLGKYTSKDFWKENQYLFFDTLTEYHTYQIIYVFTTTASKGEGFTYYQFVNALNEEDFYGFLVNCNSNSLYDTGLSASYGDKLLTLSTCEYTQENGRLVIVAKRID